MIAIPFTEFPTSSILGEKLMTAPKFGMIVRSPPLTPLLVGTPQSLTNFPALLYIPQVIMRGTTACTVLELNTRCPVVHMIPLLARVAPK